MGTTYRLPDAMRQELARPIGKVFSAGEVEGHPFVKRAKAARLVVTVGDRVTETLAAVGRVPDVQIVDSKENRVARTPPEVRHVRTIRVMNPPGTVTEGAIEGIRSAFRGKKPARVLVEGEEDLLVIPAVIAAPDATLVFYGQPGVGVVLVEVTPASKERVSGLLSRMAPG